MLNEEYTAVPMDEKEYFGTPAPRNKHAPVGTILKAILLLFLVAIGCFTVGFGVGQNWKTRPLGLRKGKDGLLPAQAFVPESTFLHSYLLSYSWIVVYEIM